MNDAMPSPAAQAGAPMMTSAHALHFVFAYRLTTPDNARAQSWVGQRLAPAVAGAGAEPAAVWTAKTLGTRPVWTQIDRVAAQKQLSPDLTPVVDRLLHGGEPTGNDGHGNGHAAPFTGFAPLALSDAIGNARLLIDYSAAARRRLLEAGVAAELIDRLGLRCAEGRLYGFASGFVLLALELRCVDLGNEGASQLPATVIEETLYALAAPPGRKQPPLLPVHAEWHACTEPLAAGTLTVVDPSLRHAVRAARDDEAAAPVVKPFQHVRPLLRAVAAGAKVLTLFRAGAVEALDLYALAAVLAGDGDPALMALTRADGHRRAFTYAAVQCPAGTDAAALETLSWRLSRRFTRDYQAQPAELQAGVLHTFANVVHAASPQGGAVVVRESDAAFLQSFVDGPAGNVYRPLALLAHHEYLLLQHHTQDCAFLPDTAHPEHDYERIQTLRTALAQFRLYFRFTHVSDMGHHNRVHRAWREALDLDRMLQELALDVREADQVLAYHQRERNEKRWRRIGAITSGLAGFIVAHEVLEALLPLIYPPYQGLLLALKGDNRDWSALEADHALHAALHYLHGLHWVEAIFFVAAVLVAAWLAIVALKKGPKLEE